MPQPALLRFTSPHRRTGRSGPVRPRPPLARRAPRRACEPGTPEPPRWPLVRRADPVERFSCCRLLGGGWLVGGRVAAPAVGFEGEGEELGALRELGVRWAGDGDLAESGY